MAEQVGAWVHERAPFDLDAIEERMDDELAAAIYESDRCIECGCCVASCGVANVRPGFVAPAGMNRLARFMMDPRDVRTDRDWAAQVPARTARTPKMRKWRISVDMSDRGGSLRSRWGSASGRRRSGRFCRTY